VANQRTTFGKRQREQNRNDKARAKQARLAARRGNSTGEKGPPIAWGEAVYANATTDDGNLTADQGASSPTDEVPSDESE
jgi:hypothetical protein